jgi:hypothetical protein
MDKRPHEGKEPKVNVDEMELAIYNNIDALQAEIKERQAAIKELLTKLPYGYIIVRTFIKDFKSHTSSYKKGFIHYYNFLTYHWIKEKEAAYVFKSFQDAEHMAKMIPNHIPDYVEIKIERIAK